jgi:hypothetical protein
MGTEEQTQARSIRVMTRLQRFRGYGLAMVIATVVGFALPAVATESDLAQLPVTDPFRCLICHVDEAPSGGSFALNGFGADFLANARIWDASLAGLDSDGDNCTNGVELGDADGDGEADGNVDTLQSNPGDPADCGGSMVDNKTWGELKALFDRN